MTRLLEAGWVFGCVLLTLPFVLFSHELITFGYIWGFKTGAREMLWLDGPFTISYLILGQLVMGVFSAAIISALTLLFYQTRLCVPALIVSYFLAYLWGAEGTASGYRHYFGATWGFSEAFWELLYHPIMTPAFFLFGLTLFLWMSRRVWQVQT